MGEDNAPTEKTENFFLIFDLKISTSSAFCDTVCYFLAVSANCTHKKHCFWAYNIAVACTQTAKGGKTSLLKTIRGTIVSFCVEYDFARWARGAQPTQSPP